MNSWIVAFLFLSAFSLRAGETRAFESWLGMGIHQRLDYGLEVGLESQEWLSSSDQSPVLRHWEISPTVTWHYSPRYDFFLGYERETEWTTERQTINTDLAVSGFTVLLPLGKWDLRSQQRFETGANDEKTVADFRHLTRVVYHGFSDRWAPYVSNEWFFNLMEGDVTQNRFLVGIEYHLTKSLTAEFYGMRRDEWEADNLSTTPIFGINLNWNF